MDRTPFLRIEQPAAGASDCGAYIAERKLVQALENWFRKVKPSEEMIAYYLGEEAVRRPWEEAEARLIALESYKVKIAWKTFGSFGPEETLFKISKRRKRWKKTS